MTYHKHVFRIINSIEMIGPPRDVTSCFYKRKAYVQLKYNQDGTYRIRVSSTHYVSRKDLENYSYITTAIKPSNVSLDEILKKMEKQ